MATKVRLKENMMQDGATLYRAPVGTDLPPKKSTWPVQGWTEFGYTIAPFVTTRNTERSDLEVEQEDLPIDSTISSDNVSSSTTLAELTPEHLAMAFNGTIDDSDPDVVDIYVGSTDTEPEYMIAAVGKRLDGKRMETYLFRTKVEMSGDMQYSRNDPTGIPITFLTYADTSRPAGQNKMAFRIYKSTVSDE